MKILIAGGTGLIGRQLTDFWKKKGHEVFVLSRSAQGDDIIRWDVNSKTIDSDLIFDVVVNLAGAGVVDKRWTVNYKNTLIQSRVDSIDTLDRYFQRLDFAPKVYINASAVGFYGHAEDHIFSETDEAIKDDFLVEVCRSWEGAVDNMITDSERTFIVRIGVVLTNDGGAFPELSKGKQLGVVPHLGKGDQVISWIAMEDLIRVFDHLLTPSVPEGIYNGVGPQPASNRALATAVAKKSGLGWSPSVPEFVIKAILGERSVAVLSSTHVNCDKLERTAFQYDYPNLDALLNKLL